jgi:hypothetical protein
MIQIQRLFAAVTNPFEASVLLPPLLHAKHRSSLTSLKAAQCTAVPRRLSRGAEMIFDAAWLFARVQMRMTTTALIAAPTAR